MDEVGSSVRKSHCKNCSHPILESAKYCSNCGQKNTDGRISIKSFFSAFFSTVFNLESKFFQTLGHIFIPGKLTVEYFKGRHKRYFHPVRFFIITALLAIAAFGYQLSSKVNMHDVYLKAENQERNKVMMADVDSILQQTLAKYPRRNSWKPAYDTLFLNLKSRFNSGTDSVDMRRSIMINEIDNLGLKIANKDLVNLSPDELVEKYKVEGFYKRYIFKQKIKLIKDKGGFEPFVLGNSLWIILLMMPFLAFILKILYIRQGYYYVEHLVFSFHSHAFAFLLFALIKILIHFDIPEWIIAIGFGFMFLYLYLALLKVYRQSKILTLFKLLVVNITYFFLFVFFLAFGLIVSMAMF